MRGKVSKLNWEFDSCILEESNTILIGIPHDEIPALSDDSLEEYPQIIDDLNLVSSHQCVFFHNVENYFSRLLTRSKESQKLMNKLTEKYISEKKITQHVGCNFFAVLNFLSARYQKTLAELIDDTQMPDSVFPSAFEIDNIVKLRRVVNPTKNRSFINYFCASHLITPSILYTGEGTLYAINYPSNLSDNEKNILYEKIICEISDSIDKEDCGMNLNIRQLLVDKAKISEDDIDEWKIKTFSKNWYIPDYLADIINFLLDEMK